MRREFPVRAAAVGKRRGQRARIAFDSLIAHPALASALGTFHANKAFSPIPLARPLPVRAITAHAFGGRQRYEINGGRKRGCQVRNNIHNSPRIVG